MKIELKGLSELNRVLSDLSNKSLNNNILRDVARKGAKIVRKEARNSMPWQLGDLGQEGKKSVVITSSRKNKTAVSVVLGGRGYQSYKGRKVYLAPTIRHMTAGRQADRRTKKGYFRGRVMERYGDFIERGFDKSRERAIDVMRRESFAIIKKRWDKSR